MPAARSWARACLTACSVSFARAVLLIDPLARARSTVRSDTPAPAAVCCDGQRAEHVDA